MSSSGAEPSWKFSLLQTRVVSWARSAVVTSRMTLRIQPQIVIDAFIFVAACVPLVLLRALGRAPSTGFWCQDSALTYPLLADTVSSTMLMILVFGGPFFLISIGETIRAMYKVKIFRQFRSEMSQLFKVYSVFLFGMIFTCLFTDSIKFLVGRLRPHFLEVCRPAWQEVNCTAGQDRFISEYTCTNKMVDERLLQESQLSFPSGHASMSIYSAVFLVLYLQTRLSVTFSLLLRLTLQMSLLLLAIFCCVTRVTDYKHFPSDVAAGALIGLSVAVVTFYQVGHRVMTSKPPQKSCPLPRAISIESEPHTPTPLLRPECLVIGHGYRGSPDSDKTGSFVHRV